tara:strand:+ start:29544 stop:29735 length:192 start_codon:yes stop_codon:yes gene_type:complete
MWKKIHEATLLMISERDEKNARLAEKLNSSGLRIYQDETVGNNEITIHVGKNLWKALNTETRN